MAKLLCAQGLTFERGVLAKPSSAGNDWDTHAVFDVEDPSNFSMRIKLLDSGSGNGHFLAGIVPHNCELNEEDIEKQAGTVFIHHLFDGIAEESKIGRPTEVEWPSVELTDHGQGFKLETEIEITYMAGDLYFAVANGPRVKVCESIPLGDYRPCITFGSPGMSIQVFTGTPARKRHDDNAHEGTTKMLKSMLGDTRFADAKVLCGSKSFPVHRAVLSTASPFFEKAFTGEMREAKECTVTITDTTEDAVEAFLEFLYTQAFPPKANILDLLPLAHRYEATGLVELCMEELAATLSVENVAQYVSMLRPLREDSAVQQRWKALHERISSDPQLVEALMIG